MRLLLVNYEYPPLGGGAGNATKNIARELAALGVDVCVLTSAFRDLPRLETVDGVTVRRVRAGRRRLECSNPLEMLAFMGAACVSALRMARSWRPDACIAFFGIPSGPVGFVLKLCCGVGYVVSLRGGDVPGFQAYDLALYHRLTGPFIRFLWRRAAAVAANSEGLRALALRSAADVPIAVIANGVDTTVFHPAETRDGEGGPVRLLFVGRLVRQKGLDVLFRSLAGLPPPANAVLDVVGDGPELPALRELGDRLGLTDTVRFRGWCARDALPEYYRCADVFVLASRDEGMPNVLLEAMASGLPVVATEVAGIDELLQEGVGGVLVPTEDPDALRDRLAELIADPALRAQLGAAGRELAERKYSWRRSAEAYLRLVEEALGSGTSP